MTVRPLDEGSGRMARANADLALARADGTKARFCTMSTQIKAERKEHYFQRAAAQHGELDIPRRLAWFLACLGRAMEGAKGQ